MADNARAEAVEDERQHFLFAYEPRLVGDRV